MQRKEHLTILHPFINIMRVLVKRVFFLGRLAGEINKSADKTSNCFLITYRTTLMTYMLFSGHE